MRGLRGAHPTTIRGYDFCWIGLSSFKVPRGLIRASRHTTVTSWAPGAAAFGIRLQRPNRSRPLPGLAALGHGHSGNPVEQQSVRDSGGQIRDPLCCWTSWLSRISGLPSAPCRILLPHQSVSPRSSLQYSGWTRRREESLEVGAALVASCSRSGRCPATRVPPIAHCHRTHWDLVGQDELTAFHRPPTGSIRHPDVHRPSQRDRAAAATPSARAASRHEPAVIPRPHPRTARRFRSGTHVGSSAICQPELSAPPDIRRRAGTGPPRPAIPAGTASALASCWSASRRWMVQR
jgi:hypothetical protein